MDCAAIGGLDWGIDHSHFVVIRGLNGLGRRAVVVVVVVVVVIIDIVINIMGCGFGNEWCIVHGKGLEGGGVILGFWL